MKARMFWVAVAATLALAIPAAAGADGVRIGIIDVNRILNESDAGKAARKKMEDTYEVLKKKLEAKQAEAKKLKDEIDSERIIVDKKEKLKAKEEVLASRVNELRQMTQESEKEMQAKQRDLERAILASIEAKINTVVESEKIDILLDRAQGGVLHFRPELDITAKVLELVNKDTAAPAADAGGKGTEKTTEKAKEKAKVPEKKKEKTGAK